eukprot:4614447-Pyramimonas_sp.AAC.1
MTSVPNMVFGHNVDSHGEATMLIRGVQARNSVLAGLGIVTPQQYWCFAALKSQKKVFQHSSGISNGCLPTENFLQ